MKTTIINWLLVLFVSLSWGASFMFTRLVVEEISPSHLVSIRLLLAALLLGPLFINKEEFLKMSKVIPSLILLGIINAALPFFLFAWSAQELTAGMLSILNGTSLFRQNPTFFQEIGLLAGFIGLLIFIGLDEIRVVFFPVTLCLIGAFCYAYSNNVLFKLNHINSSALASATMLSGFVFSIPLFLSESQSFSFDLSLKTYLATLFLGLVSTGISFIAYVVLLQRSSPVQASSIIFLVPITGIFWGAIFLNENIDQKVILGSLCILVGIGLTNIFKPKKLLRD